MILVKVLHIGLKNTLLAWGWLQAIYSTIPSFFKRLSFRSRNWCPIWDRYSHVQQCSFPQQVDVQYCTALYTIQLGAGKSKKNYIYIYIHFWSLMLMMSCFHVIPLNILWNPPLISSSGCFPHPKYGRFPMSHPPLERPQKPCDKPWRWVQIVPSISRRAAGTDLKRSWMTWVVAGSSS